MAKKTMYKVIFLYLFFFIRLGLISGQCQDRQGRPRTKSNPQDCIDFQGVSRTRPIPKDTTANYNAQRTNSINDFCILTRMYESKAPNPTPLGEAKKDCYTPKPGSGAFHTAGGDPNWAILEHLVQHKAQSYQPFDDLPFVQSHYHLFDDSSFIKLDKPFPQKSLPTGLGPNPYFVEVTGISFKGELLHNFLHFRIFANMSVALGSGQSQRAKILHGGQDLRNEERPHHASGRISAALIMIKDQDGWPVGDFSTVIPCSRTCTKYSHDVYYGDESNAVPCSYTPPYASSHPGMFVFDRDPGRYCTHPGIPEDGTSPTSGVDSLGGNSINSEDPRLNAQTARLEGVREVHATWSFGHNTCNFVERLYIQTLVFEDVETVYRGKLESQGNYDKHFLFGWTAQYNILKTTRGTLGAPDYVDLKYMQLRDSRAHEVDCHVALFDAENTVPFTFRKFLVPSHANLEDSHNAPVKTEIEVPSRSPYLGALWNLYGSATMRRYFGQNARKYPTGGSAPPVCRDPPRSFLMSESEKKIYGEKPLESLSKFLENEKNAGIRCPCPALPSTLPPENRTADPARLHGRLIHASHMAIAYMFLTPIGCFVVRYYKETLPTVFCFQEYWWFMWHVVALIGACLFNIGAITSIARKKQEELIYGSNLKVHVILGAMSIFVFYMEIITGFFRAANPKRRMRQIFLHWLIGLTNNSCAVLSMFSMAWVDQSGFSCNVAYTVTFWLIFVITCYVIMEWHMRKTDKLLNLVPRRSYLPPPVKRRFTRETPGREFKLIMLAIFIFGLLILQGFVSYYIWNATDGASCEEDFRRYYQTRRPVRGTEVDEAAGVEELGELEGDDVEREY